jgi:hypothetical protein
MDIENGNSFSINHPINKHGDNKIGKEDNSILQTEKAGYTSQ